MASDKKQRKAFKTYLPKEKKPFKVSYDCPLSEELNVKEYNVLIDSDPVENQIYINLGYDNRSEYDSAFYLSPQHAMEIGKKLIEYATHVDDQYLKYHTGEVELDILKSLLAANLVEEITIEPKKLFTMDVDDSLFGRMIIDISYKSTLYDTEKSFTVLSQQIDSDNSDDIIKYLEEHTKECKFDYLQYKYLIDSMKTLRTKWLESHKRQKPKTEIMKKKEDIGQLVDSVVDLIKNNGKS